MEPSDLDSARDKFDNDEKNGSPSSAIDAANDPDGEQQKRQEGSQVAPAAEAEATAASATTDSATAAASQTPRRSGADTTSTSSILKDLTSPHLRPFAIISTSYLLFTVTDGAIRMIVLLHAYNLNFSALEVAIMFTLYELAGAVTNLAAGIMGAKWGIKLTLITGLRTSAL